MAKTMELPGGRYAALGVESNGTTAVDVVSIPIDHEVSEVWARVAVTGTGTDDSALPPKKYVATGKEIKLVLSGAGTIQSFWDVYFKMSKIPASS
jgi:hypothetical protein